MGITGLEHDARVYVSHAAGGIEHLTSSESLPREQDALILEVSDVDERAPRQPMLAGDRGKDPERKQQAPGQPIVAASDGQAKVRLTTLDEPQGVGATFLEELNVDSGPRLDITREKWREQALDHLRRGGDRDLTILNIVWTPGMAAYPHDHPCGPGGREDNTFYRRGPAGLQVAGGRQLETGDTALFGESMIHSVVNPLRAFTGAIHIYGGDFFGTPRSDWDPDTLQERPYDVERARKLIADANERWLAECARADGS